MFEQIWIASFLPLLMYHQCFNEICDVIPYVKTNACVILVVYCCYYILTINIVLIFVIYKIQ